MKKYLFYIPTMILALVFLISGTILTTPVAHANDGMYEAEDEDKDEDKDESEDEDESNDRDEDEDGDEDGDDDRKPMFVRDGKEHMGMPILTAEQKATLKEVRASGDKEAVASTLKEFGIDMPSKEVMEKKMAERKTQMEAVKAAIDAGDYTAYQAAVAGTVMADKVDSATFETLVKAHDLRAEGDTAGAVALVKGLGMDVMHKEFTKKFVRQNLEAADKELVKQAKELMKSGDAVAAQEIFTDLKEKYEVELAQPIKKFSLFGWLKQKRN